jgi:hypothetical protein
MSLEQLQSPTESDSDNCADNFSSRLLALHLFQKEGVSEFEAMVCTLVVCLILWGEKERHVGTQSVSLVRGYALVVRHELLVTSTITAPVRKPPISYASPPRTLALSLAFTSRRSH